MLHNRLHQLLSLPSHHDGFAYFSLDWAGGAGSDRHILAPHCAWKRHCDETISALSRFHHTRSINANKIQKMFKNASLIVHCHPVGTIDDTRNSEVCSTSPGVSNRQVASKKAHSRSGIHGTTMPPHHFKKWISKMGAMMARASWSFWHVKEKSALRRRESRVLASVHRR